MVAGTVARAPHNAQGLALAHLLTLGHTKPTQVAVDRAHARGAIDDDVEAVAAAWVTTCEGDGTVRGGQDVAVTLSDVYAQGMRRAEVAANPPRGRPGNPDIA